MRSSPVTDARALCPPATVVSAPVCGAPVSRSCSETSSWARANVMNGRRSLPPTAGVAVAVGAGNHGVSDPGARARNGPAPVRRGRSRHGCLCRFRLSETACSAARSAACLLHRTRSIATQIFRTIRSRSSGKCCPQTGHVRACLPASCCPGNRGSRAAAFDVDLRPS